MPFSRSHIAALLSKSNKTTFRNDGNTILGKALNGFKFKRHIFSNLPCFFCADLNNTALNNKEQHNDSKNKNAYNNESSNLSSVHSPSFELNNNERTNE